MFKTIKRLAVATVLILAPFPASAITVSEMFSGLVPSGASFVVTGGTDLSFVALELNPAGSTGPTVFVYDFVTAGSGPIMAEVTGAGSVNLLNGGPALGQPMFAFDKDVSPTSLTVTFGDAAFADLFTFDVAFAAIPLPAGALLLLTGLGGLALLRRRPTPVA